MNVEKECLNLGEVGKSQISDILRFRNTALKARCNPVFLQRKERLHTNFFHRKSKVVKKWRSRAWSIDPNKTNLTIVFRKDSSSQHVPPWIYRKWLVSGSAFMAVTRPWWLILLIPTSKGESKYAYLGPRI